jgi:hypothetical protein
MLELRARRCCCNLQYQNTIIKTDEKIRNAEAQWGVETKLYVLCSRIR